VSIAAALIRVDGKGSVTVAMLTGGFALSEIHFKAADEQRLTWIENNWLKTTAACHRLLSAADDRAAGFFSHPASDTIGPPWSAIIML